MTVPALVLAVVLAAPPADSGRAAMPPVKVKAPDTTLVQPSFAGRWKLSMTRSVFGNLPGGKPTARTDLIEQDGRHLRQTLYLLRGAQRDTTIYVYDVGGSPTVNRVDGRDIRSVVGWEGTTLHLVSTAKLMMLNTTLDERWALAPDGRVLTYTRHVDYGFGKGDQTLVFERERRP